MTQFTESVDTQQNRFPGIAGFIFIPLVYTPKHLTTHRLPRRRGVAPAALQWEQPVQING